MKVYTKTGDKGETSLLGGTRLPKSALRIEAYGTVDELNSYIGLLRDQAVNTRHIELLISIQNHLFVIGADLATDPQKTKVKKPPVEPEETEQLERAIDVLDGDLPPMKFFVLPGGHQSVSFGHVARTVCRRAERIVIALAQEEYVADEVQIYLNRLSDYLFVLCRWMAVQLNIDEVPWRPNKQ
ncbi:cob(I)yrinic acid a,c-diamide adenosyltransferase [Reichenbachiella agariperforans]|uniref:cob(I)yrinic acid a,c-diamide adenosyltransferase n=1 Tax=Reichenbachiella agariperforans TaxID=156994 RepID=UPI001C08F0C9|nr:cob(I)yrinic acid a,c-diamide adenosyltransferase [Reichenbachiella agariperforans]MBU2912783.1 cob(I)yrinic acid a,c-diamide adenosyltransferase [Reichenbachiella agariperforans]